VRSRFEIRQEGACLVAWFHGTLDGESFLEATASIRSCLATDEAVIDVTRLAYVDSFEMLVIEEVMDLAKSTSIRCNGVVKEVLAFCLASKPNVALLDGSTTTA
jgi:anti-anti-sigma regulatory factor